MTEKVNYALAKNLAENKGFCAWLMMAPAWRSVFAELIVDDIPDWMDEDRVLRGMMGAICVVSMVAGGLIAYYGLFQGKGMNFFDGLLATSVTTPISERRAFLYCVAMVLVPVVLTVDYFLAQDVPSLLNTDLEAAYVGAPVSLAAGLFVLAILKWRKETQLESTKDKGLEIYYNNWDLAYFFAVLTAGLGIILFLEYLPDFSVATEPQLNVFAALFSGGLLVWAVIEAVARWRDNGELEQRLQALSGKTQKSDAEEIQMRAIRMAKVPYYISYKHREADSRLTPDQENFLFRTAGV